MKLDQIFVDRGIPDGMRCCGTCGKIKPFADFYKDGKDKDGNVKYRRDCKDCYKSARIQAERMTKGHGKE